MMSRAGTTSPTLGWLRRSEVGQDRVTRRRRPIRDGLDGDWIAIALGAPYGPENRQGHLPWEVGGLGEVEDQPIHQPCEDLDCINDRVGVRCGATPAHDEPAVAGDERNVGHVLLL